MRRYSRHLLIPQVGLAGQKKLAASRVLCVGAGGLGCAALQYLAAAGVGLIGIIDDDSVDITNLQRQVLFTTADVGRRKAEVAAERMTALNPEVSLLTLCARFDASNARELVRSYDIVVDATDTFSSRYLINDACRLEGKPDVYGSIFRFDGQVSVFAPGGPCYRCLFPEPPPQGGVPTCAEGGVLGVLAGMIGTWQANEVLKLALGIGESLIGRLALIEALGARVRTLALARDVGCALCGDAPTITDAVDCARPTCESSGILDLDVLELDAFLAEHRDALLLDVREPHEVAFGMVKGAAHMPASQLEARMHELDSAKTYVVACRVGTKSRWAVGRLREAGFGRLRHLRDGLSAYAALDAADFEFF
jgi:molybdopterin/thiamine biosynthesis adenylyltransferase/rhodanese-related sulfurtransferase